MFQTILQKAVPHLISLLICFAVISFFYYPHWQGKVLNQSDVSSWESAAHEIMEFNKTHDEPTLWTNSMFGGMPAYQIASETQSNLLYYVQSFLTFGTSGPIATFLLCAISFYILFLTLGLSIPLAIIGAISSVLLTSNFLLFEGGHLPKLIVLSTIGFITAGIILTFRKKLWAGLGLYGLGIGLNILNNHVQMTYYTYMFLSPIVIMYAIAYFREKDYKTFFINCIALAGITVLGLLASASTVLPTIEYSKQTMRGAPILESKGDITSSSEVEGLEWNYAMAWSNGVPDIIASIIPGAAGGGSGEQLDKTSAIAKDLRKKGYNPPKNLRAPLYWGSLPFTGGPFYFGAILCFLFVLGLFTVKGPIKWWLSSAVFLGIILSMGKNAEWFNKLLFDYLPLYNKFRAPSSVISVAGYFVPILGLLALHQIGAKDFSFDKFKKQLLYSLGITAGFCLLMAILGSSLFDFSHANDARTIQSGFDQNALIEDRQSLLSSDAFRSILYILLSAGAVFFYANKKINGTIAAIALGALIVFDLGGVARRYVAPDDFMKKSAKKEMQKARAVDQQIMADKSYYRVLDLTIDHFNNSQPSFFHHNVGGYHPAKLQRIQDLIDHHIGPEINALSSAIPSITTDSSLQQAFNRLQVLNAMNTKYFILGQPGKEIATTNLRANGPAWFIKEIQWAENANQEIENIKGKDLKQTAIVHTEFKNNITTSQFDGQGTIEQKTYAPNKISYQSNSQGNQFAVFSEMWYGPNLGWTITVDGQEKELVRTNYGFRGVEVPAGQHEIVMEFKPNSYYMGKTIGTVCSLMLLGLLGFVIYRELKQTQLEKKS